MITATKLEDIKEMEWRLKLNAAQIFHAFKDATKKDRVILYRNRKGCPPSTGTVVGMRIKADGGLSISVRNLSSKKVRNISLQNIIAEEEMQHGKNNA